MTGVALVKTHANLSASAAYRWMACGGSVRLSQGLPNVSSPYAIEGTIAHDLGERSLSKSIDPEMYVGLELEDPESGEKIVVTEEMADHVRVYTDYCHSLIRPGTKFWIERKFSLAKLNPPGNMYGTSDFPCYQPEEYLLEIVDLKYGQGVVVEVEWNEQELYYALGAVIALQEEFPGLRIDRVKITIIQPRIAHRNGPIRSWEISIEELIAFADTLLLRARAALEPDAPLVSGDHCRFCPAAGICPELARYSITEAQMEFSDDLDVVKPPAPATLSPDRIAQLLRARPIVEAWFNAVHAYALGEAEQGAEYPGWKIVPKKGKRAWIGEDADVIHGLAMRGLKKEQFTVEKLLTAPQLEKKLGKKKFAEFVPTQMYEKVSSGYTLAQLADVRPALQIGAQVDFEVLPNNAGQEEIM